MALEKEVVGRIPATPVNVTVLDLSTSGCLVEATAPLIKQGRTILLSLSDSVEIAGQVVWQDGSRFGVQFHREISTDELSSLMVRPDDRESGTSLRDRFGRLLPPLSARIRI